MRKSLSSYNVGRIFEHLNPISIMREDSGGV